MAHGATEGKTAGKWARGAAQAAQAGPAGGLRAVTQVIGVLGIYLAMGSTMIVNPVLAFIGQELNPGIPYSSLTLLSTLFSLAALPGALVCGAVAGRRVSYRALAAVATLTVGVVGSLPFFYDDFLFVLGTRAVAGFAQGILSALYNGTVALSVFPLDRATRVQGAGSIVGNLAGIFYQVSSAALAAVSIRYIWLIHTFLLMPFILDVLFMPRTQLAADAGEKDAAAARGSAAARGRSPLPLIAVAAAAVYAAFLLFMGPVNLVVSSVVSGEGLGNSADIAMICALYTVGGMLGGVAFDRFYHMSGRWFYLCSLGLLAAGIGSAAFTHSVAGYAFGAACCGFALFLFQPGSMVFLSTEVGPAALAGVSGFFMAAGSLASFANTPYMMLVSAATGSDNPRYPLMAGCIAVAFIALVWGLAMARRGKRRRA